MKVGYYRYKITGLSPGEHFFQWYENGELAGVSRVVVRAKCSEQGKYIKYLDSKGIYRFFCFNNRWRASYSGKKLGSVNKFVESIADAEASEENVGYKATNSYILTSEDVPDWQLAMLADVYNSPRVYLKIGAEKYVQVEVSGDGVSRRMNRNTGKVSLTVKLPEHYAVTTV